MSSASKPLILIVEDDRDLAGLIAEQLEMANMQTQVCNRAAHAARFVSTNFVNLMLLDVNLPDQTGFALIEQLHQESIRVPTIFLTGADAEIQRVKGLELGGDDYITKPFSFAELVARIHAVLRRSETIRDHNVTENAQVTEAPFSLVGAEVQPSCMQIVFPNGNTEAIGPKELGILSFIHKHQGQVITRKAIIHAVWGIHADVRSRSLDQYVARVRQLFNEHQCPLTSFRTLHGIGYIYDLARTEQPTEA